MIAPHMPTALTVVVPVPLTVIVPPLWMYCAVPDPGTGVDPSVVYQMPVFASRLLDETPGTPVVMPFEKVTTCEPLKLPLAGDIEGDTEVYVPVPAVE